MEVNTIYGISSLPLLKSHVLDILNNTSEKKCMRTPPVKPEPGEYFVYTTNVKNKFYDWENDGYNWVYDGLEFVPDQNPVYTICHYTNFEKTNIRKQVYSLTNIDRNHSNKVLIHYYDKSYSKNKNSNSNNAKQTLQLLSTEQKNLLILNNQENSNLKMPSTELSVPAEYINKFTPEDHSVQMLTGPLDQGFKGDVSEIQYIVLDESNIIEVQVPKLIMPDNTVSVANLLNADPEGKNVERTETNKIVESSLVQESTEDGSRIYGIAPFLSKDEILDILLNPNLDKCTNHAPRLPKPGEFYFYVTNVQRFYNKWKYDHQRWINRGLNIFHESKPPLKVTYFKGKTINLSKRVYYLYKDGKNCFDKVLVHYVSNTACKIPKTSPSRLASENKELEHKTYKGPMKRVSRLQISLNNPSSATAVANPPTALRGATSKVTGSVEIKKTKSNALETKKNKSRIYGICHDLILPKNLIIDILQKPDLNKCTCCAPQNPKPGEYYLFVKNDNKFYNNWNDDGGRWLYEGKKCYRDNYIPFTVTYYKSTITNLRKHAFFLYKDGKNCFDKVLVLYLTSSHLDIDIETQEVLNTNNSLKLREKLPANADGSRVYGSSVYLSRENILDILLHPQLDKCTIYSPICPKPGEIYVFATNIIAFYYKWKYDHHRWLNRGSKIFTDSRPPFKVTFFKGGNNMMKRVYCLYKDGKCCYDKVLVHYLRDLSSDTVINSPTALDINGANISNVTEDIEINTNTASNAIENVELSNSVGETQEVEIETSELTEQERTKPYGFSTEILPKNQILSILENPEIDMCINVPPVKPQPGEYFVYIADDESKINDWMNDHCLWSRQGKRCVPKAKPIFKMLLYKQQYTNFMKRVYFYFASERNTIKSRTVLIHYLGDFDKYTLEPPIKDMQANNMEVEKQNFYGFSKERLLSNQAYFILQSPKMEKCIRSAPINPKPGEYYLFVPDDESKADVWKNDGYTWLPKYKKNGPQKKNEPLYKLSCYRHKATNFKRIVYSLLSTETNNEKNMKLIHYIGDFNEYIPRRSNAPIPTSNSLSKSQKVKRKSSHSENEDCHTAFRSKRPKINFTNESEMSPQEMVCELQEDNENEDDDMIFIKEAHSQSLNQEMDCEDKENDGDNDDVIFIKEVCSQSQNQELERESRVDNGNSGNGINESKSVNQKMDCENKENNGNNDNVIFIKEVCSRSQNQELERESRVDNDNSGNGIIEVINVYYNKAYGWSLDPLSNEKVLDILQNPNKTKCISSPPHQPKPGEYYVYVTDDESKASNWKFDAYSRNWMRIKLCKVNNLFRIIYFRYGATNLFKRVYYLHSETDNRIKVWRANEIILIHYLGSLEGVMTNSDWDSLYKSILKKPTTLPEKNYLRSKEKKDKNSILNRLLTVQKTSTQNSKPLEAQGIQKKNTEFSSVNNAHILIDNEIIIESTSDGTNFLNFNISQTPSDNQVIKSITHDHDSYCKPMEVNRSEEQNSFTVNESFTPQAASFKSSKTTPDYETMYKALFEEHEKLKTKFKEQASEIEKLKKQKLEGKKNWPPLRTY